MEQGWNRHGSGRSYTNRVCLRMLTWSLGTGAVITCVRFVVVVCLFVCVRPDITAKVDWP